MTFILSPKLEYKVLKFDLAEGTEMRSGFIQKRCPKCGSDK